MEELFQQRKEKLNLFKALIRPPKPVKPKEVPTGLYTRCTDCGQDILSEELEQNLFVCPLCGAHMKLYAPKRIKMLVDEGSFREMNERLKGKNVLGFPGYNSKIDKLQRLTGLNEAVITGIGKIEGVRTAIGVMDSRFIMGSMGAVVGEKITRLVEYATRKRLPLVLFSASGGARMQEGIISLMQMAKTSNAIARHHQAGLLYISYMTHPTTGGVTASFASLGDIILAEPKCLIGFAGQRVIEQTVNQKLPEGFQRAEFMQQQGFVDRVVERKDMRSTLAFLLKFHRQEG